MISLKIAVWIVIGCLLVGIIGGVIEYVFFNNEDAKTDDYSDSSEEKQEDESVEEILASIRYNFVEKEKHYHYELVRGNGITRPNRWEKISDD